MQRNENATKFCPVSHKFDKWMYCYVLSRSDNRILVRHFNGESGKVTLSIYEHYRNTWLMHPEKYDSTWNPRGFNGKIRLDPNFKDSLIINGRKLPILKQYKKK